MNKEFTKTIFIAGGHITPALALMDEIAKKHPQWRIVCVGRRIAIEGTQAESVERSLVEARGATFIPLTAGRLSRSIGIQGLISLLKIPVGYIQAFWYCLRYKPAIVVSFGGYVALPVAMVAFILRIPVITHEQTRVVGLANRIIGIVAQKICITFEDQLDHFPKNKTVVTGLPMRRELFDPPKVTSFSVDTTLPILYITGGSTGAVSLNDALFPVISQLTKAYTVFHQTGKLSRAYATQLHDGLPEAQKNRYVVGDFFDSVQVSWILHAATLVIGRSGANTVMEVATLGKTMLCIPLPWSASGEQDANAQWLEKKGLATILSQSEVNSDKIISSIDAMVKTISQEKSLEASSTLPRDGAQRLLTEVDAILVK